MTPPIAKPGDVGEILCPHCGTHILTPTGYDLQEGEAPCPICRKKLRVTAEVATEANRRARAPGRQN